jgi:hypothetical protein
MKPQETWSFSCPLEDVDVPRILREAGPDARLVRFTIGEKQYTAISLAYARKSGEALAAIDGAEPDPGPYGDYIDWEGEQPCYLCSNCSGDDGPNTRADGEVQISCWSAARYRDAGCDWALSRDPKCVEKFLEVKTTKVEVF